MSNLPIYVLDLSVLLYDPQAIMAYPASEVVLPIEVVEKLDEFKNDMSDVGHNARQIVKLLDGLRSKGRFSEGIQLDNGSKFRIILKNYADGMSQYGLRDAKASSQVLAVMQNLIRQGHKVVLVTMETSLRVKANALGLDVIAYDGETKKETDLFVGVRRMEVSPHDYSQIMKKNSFQIEGEYMPYEGLVAINQEDKEQTLTAIYDPKRKSFIRVQYDRGIWGIQPRNPEQHLALDILLNPDINIVTLVGKAGTGKTLLALAVGLQMMLVENKYTRMLVSRPIFPMGRDLGYLPGDVQDKLAPWMQPIFDNLELLLGSTQSGKGTTKGHRELLDQGLLVIEPLTYIRGRSIPYQYMIVDEAQNLTPHEIKTIITRAGYGTKLIITGDPYQIDNPYVNLYTNGLSYIVERFKKYPIAGHITLVRGERSPLAELAANVL